MLLPLTGLVHLAGASLQLPPAAGCPFSLALSIFVHADPFSGGNTREESVNDSQASEVV